MDSCDTNTRPTPTDLPQIWRIRFDLIELAGGPGLSKKKKLTLGERLRMFFNIWAFLFGPLYYLAKGMWRKALLYWLPGTLLLFLAGAVAPDINWEPLQRGVGIAITVLFTLRANIDYYKKMVLHDNGWW